MTDPTPQTAEPWLTVKQAAALLGIGAQSVRDLCHAGRLPHYRPFGRIFRFKRSELEAYLRSRHAGGSGWWGDVA